MRNKQSLMERQRPCPVIKFTLLAKCTNIPISAPPAEVQATRAVMLLSIFISTVAVLVSTVGMKCTHFMDSKPDSKSTTAMTGGIMFMVAGAFMT